MKKRIVFFYITLTVVLSGQNQLQIQLDYANRLFSVRQYYDAITEYKRLLFFDSENKFNYLVNFNIGLCYKEGAIFDEAIKHFSIAELNSSNTQEKYAVKIEIVKANILRRTTGRALQILDEMEKEPAYNSKTDSLFYWRGWAYIFEDRWESAAQSFNKINSYHELKLLSNRVIKEKYSVTFAKVISYILPGMGQIYTGNYIKGFMSLGYNVLFGYLTVNSFAENRVFDGIAIGSLLWLRFYRGSVQNAEESAIEKNIQVSNKTLRFLQTEYMGEKP